MGAASTSCLLALALLLGCQQHEAPARPGTPAPPQLDETAEDYVPAPLPRASVFLEDAFGASHRVEVEVAATPEARARGLMWRRSLPAGQGMLFVFPDDSDHGFWMRNTFIPLDMLFIDAERRIVGIVENATPHSLVSRSVGRPSRYVLEVPGGWSQSVGVRTGSRVRMEGVDRVPVVP